MRAAARAMTAVLLLASTLPGAGLREEIERLIDESPAARNAFWGIQVVELAGGKTLYQLNSNRFFVPASNVKLFSSALSLVRLGPDFRFQTRVMADAPPDANGLISGALRLLGGGDPNLSPRAVPYRMGSIAGNPLAAIENLADRVVARGVRQVDGGIVGDDTWYVWQPYAPGWGLEDPESDDGPPVSALSINDNTISMTVRPGARSGDAAILSLDPPLEYYRIDNRLRTTGLATERRITVDRIPGSFDLRVWGTIPIRDRAQSFLLGIEDPAWYAARALRAALAERGVTVRGETVARHLFPYEVPDLLKGAPAAAAGGAELARLTSAPLVEALRIANKVSQNLHSELALRAVARARRNVGSFEAGLEEMTAFLAEAGIAAQEFDLRDGSGLARLNLLTPSAVIRLLQYMYASPYRDTWIGLMPVGGQDGTLSSRFGQSPGAGRVYAKTGSLSHVAALSGYIRRNDETWVAFSILVNNHNARSADIRGVIDGICNLIVE